MTTAPSGVMVWDFMRRARRDEIWPVSFCISSWLTPCLLRPVTAQGGRALREFDCYRCFAARRDAHIDSENAIFFGFGNYLAVVVERLIDGAP